MGKQDSGHAVKMNFTTSGEEYFLYFQIGSWREYPEVTGLMEHHALCSSDGKKSACNAGDRGLIPGSGRSPRERNGYLLQYSCLENIPWTEEPHGLQSMGSQRVQHSLATNTFISLHFPAVSLGTLGIKRLPIHGPKILIPHILLYHPQREQGNL